MEILPFLPPSIAIKGPGSGLRTLVQGEVGVAFGAKRWTLNEEPFPSLRQHGFQLPFPHQKHGDWRTPVCLWGDTSHFRLKTRLNQKQASSRYHLNPSSFVLPFPPLLLSLALFLQPKSSRVQHPGPPLHSHACQRSVGHWFSPEHAGGLVRHGMLSLTPELLA